MKKRIWCMFMAMVLALSVLVTAAFAEPKTAGKTGDVNMDGQINAADALLVLKHAVGKTVLSDEAQFYGDANCDDTLDAVDALWILQAAVGLRTLPEKEQEEPNVTPTTPTPTDPEEPTPGVPTANGVADYVTKYADCLSAEVWTSDNILSRNAPPVSFQIGSISSDKLSWTKTLGDVKTIVDYPEEEAFNRQVQVVTYRCSKMKLRVEMTLTSYPGYPVVEYEAMLYNEAEGNSSTLKDLQSISTYVEDKNSDHVLHATRGSMQTDTDYAPLTYTSMTEGVSFSVTDGNPTSAYLPNFNVENPVHNTGTIAVLNWQGNWKSTFLEDENGVCLTAGQYRTDFVLQQDESVRFPGVVLMFYKGDYLNGQNLFRRWLYQCNLFREQGTHMKDTNVLVCPSSNDEQSNLDFIAYCKQSGLNDLIDKFNIDADWYPRPDYADWTFVGNWTPSSRYPNGLKPIADAVHDAGMEFALWFEPERAYPGSNAFLALKDSVIALDGGGNLLSADEIPATSQYNLLNLGNDKVVDYLAETINTQIKAGGIDQYRQDHNIRPGAYWNAWDQSEASSLGIARTGLTENFYCTGYLDLWSRLEDTNPGMYFDSCASGGRRYDLSTSRFAFMHTRSDYWWDDEVAQSQLYGCCMWVLYHGTGTQNTSDYGIRSHISTSWGVGFDVSADPSFVRGMITQWKDAADYLMYDFYPLSGYAGTTDRTMSLQYDSPEEGKGMIITYFRKDDTFTVRPRGLDPKAQYEIWDYDAPETTKKTVTGEELMKGFSLQGQAKTAPMYFYALAEGQSTKDFQTEKVPTGEGSTDYVPGSGGLRLYKAGTPSVNAAYPAQGISDEDLKAAYAITRDNQVSFVSYDYSGSGGIYAISKNIFDGVGRTGETVNGWQAVDKTRTYIVMPAGTFPYNQWDVGASAFTQAPYVREIDGTYFLWLTNTTGLQDADGGWTEFNIRFQWYDGENVLHFSEDYQLHLSGSRITAVDGSNLIETNDRVYAVDEAIFGSLPYTGNGTDVNGNVWYQVDAKQSGVISRPAMKAPPETVDKTEMIQFFSSISNTTELFASCIDGQYYLWFRGSDSIGQHLYFNRNMLAWIDVNGDYCYQTFATDWNSGVQ